jgi:hypothetical protein
MATARLSMPLNDRGISDYSQQTDGFLPLRAFKPSSSEGADRGRSIIQVTDNREYIKIQEWLMSYVQSNI